jgi:hypothetical protein
MSERLERMFCAYERELSKWPCDANMERSIIEDARCILSGSPIEPSHAGWYCAECDEVHSARYGKWMPDTGRYIETTGCPKRDAPSENSNE